MWCLENKGKKEKTVVERLQLIYTTLSRTLRWNGGVISQHKAVTVSIIVLGL